MSTLTNKGMVRRGLEDGNKNTSFRPYRISVRAGRVVSFVIVILVSDLQ